jgi:hypothetical protein
MMLLFFILNLFNVHFSFQMVAQRFQAVTLQPQPIAPYHHERRLTRTRCQLLPSDRKSFYRTQTLLYRQLRRVYIADTETQERHRQIRQYSGSYDDDDDVPYIGALPAQRTIQSRRSIILKEISRGLSSVALPAFAQTQYGKHGMRIIERLTSLHPNLDVLIVDPAIVMRINDFEAFARPRLLHGTLVNPWHLREAYSDSLGYVSVYRTMILTEEAKNEILEIGINSEIAKIHADRNFGKVKIAVRPLQNVIREHLTGRHPYRVDFENVSSVSDMFISTR